MWPNVNGNVLTNQIDIRSEKTHEMTKNTIINYRLVDNLAAKVILEKS